MHFSINSFIKHFLLLALFSFLLIQACTRKTENQLHVDVEIQVLTDQNIADSEMDDVASIYTEILSVLAKKMEAGRDTTFEYDQCASVTTQIVEKKLTVDFGASGCLGRDGRTRKGKYVITYTSQFFAVGAVVYVAFQNYEVKRTRSQVFVRIDNNSTFRQETIEMMSGGSFRFTRTMNARLNFADGSAFTWQGARQIIWLSLAISNRFEYDWTTDTTSTGSGTSRKGNNFTLKFMSPIQVLGQCMGQGINRPVRGKLAVNSSGTTRSIDFGDGSCTGQVETVVNGVSRTMVLP